MNEQLRLQFKVSKSGLLLREFLHLKSISKRTLTATKYDGGKLLVNGIERDVRHSLNPGDEVEIHFPPEKISLGLEVEHGELDLVYEDNALIVINKPAGQSTIPSRDHPSGTIANYLAGKFTRERVPSTVHIVTRLDRNTSGLICIAKNRHIHHLLGQQMIEYDFFRRYEAIVEGHIMKDAFSIEEPIGREDGSIIKRVVRDDGQYARTDVQVSERFYIRGRALTRVKLNLHTGRTHQIRVHLEWAGHPLVGDDLYGGNNLFIARQALHCSALRFTHPLSGELKVFRSKVPEDMRFLNQYQ